ncbi:MAG: hypothetical protein Ta2G_17710 [Termitinemataceae bacterium]|nr:MAG: hypothetical protein Ta2G_17710 [Termitinemataceae bacterium]
MDHQIVDEQQEVEKYVLEKEMLRPKTNVFTVIKCFFVFLSSAFGFTIAGYFFLKKCFPGIAAFVKVVMTEKPFIVCSGLFIICIVIGMLINLKSIVIGFVHLYQHYAPEEVRRRCLFKPTCSEYTILAIEKYGLRKGLSKSFDRFSRCHGEIYRIDYP